MKSKKTSILIAAAIAFALTACNTSPENSDEHSESEEMHEHSHEGGEESHEHHHDGDSVHNHDEDTSNHEMSEVIYQCPMHPEVTSDKPGTCSKCGMQLEEKTK